MQMTSEPIEETDYYGKGFAQLDHVRRMLGPPRMNFGGLRTDQDRIDQASNANSFIDSAPTEPERMTWKMRPRNKSKEIGPSMRFNAHL